MAYAPGRSSLPPSFPCHPRLPYTLTNPPALHLHSVACGDAVVVVRLRPGPPLPSPPSLPVIITIRHSPWRVFLTKSMAAAVTTAGGPPSKLPIQWLANSVWCCGMRWRGNEVVHFEQRRTSSPLQAELPIQWPANSVGGVLCLVSEVVRFAGKKNVVAVAGLWLDDDGRLP